MKRQLLAAALLAAGVAGGLRAQETRRFEPIPAPNPWRRAAERRPAAFRPVDEKKVERVFRDLVRAWNTPELLHLIGESYYDANQLLDSLAATPRDARLRLLSIEAVQTLEQESREVAGRGLLVRSTVAVIARTQVEFNDPLRGFLRRDGTNEYIFELIEEAKR